MNLYQRIQKWVKGTLIIGGLVAVLSGCGTRVTNIESGQKNYFQIFKDLNKDGIPEHVYLENTHRDTNTAGNSDRDKWYDFNLRMAVGKGKGDFEKPKITHTFPREPSEVRFEDVTGDGVPDLVYLINTGENTDITGDTSYTQWYDFDLIMRENKGDGTFEKQKLIRRFPQEP